MALDTQVVELLGRQRLMGELLRDGLEVAVPTRDRGVDLVAYADLIPQVRAFVARPIQMKAFSATGFGVAKKYKRIADLLLAYVWNLETPHEAITFAMSYDEAVSVAKDMGWTKTASWKSGAYSTSAPSKKLIARLERHKMTPGRWWHLVVGR